jgi:type I restriction enzyme S subunit
MNKIDELIAQYCPNGVEYKKLGEVCEIKTGQQVSKIEIQQNPGKFPVINSGREPLGFINQYNTENNPIGITTRGAGVGSITWCEGKYFRGNLNYSATIKNPKLLDVRFLYHILINSRTSIQKLATFNGIPALNKSKLEKLTIPIPPLPVQQEIVNILDKFTELEAKLEAELEARRKQYEYYRNQLLTPVEVDGKWLMNGVEVEWKTLGEVCLKTENIKWKENQNIDYQYIDLSSVNRDNNKITETKTINSTNAPSRAKQIVYKDDVIFGTTRPTLKRYTLITSKYHNQICSTGFCVLRANQKLLLPKFLFFILTTSSFYNYIDNNQEGAGYPSISDSIVKKFQIPIPPLSEQERIVEILDKFDKLVNDISEGLPAEIKARQKQYEYYRGKLLNFKKVNE